MGIQVRDKYLPTAATKIRNLIHGLGVSCIVWSIGDGGFMVARSNSVQTTNIRNLWPDSVAGEYTKVSNAQLRDDLALAEKGHRYLPDVKSENRKTWERQYQKNRRSLGLAA